MTWTINGVDPRAAYGLVVSEVQGWADDVAEKYQTVAVPGVPGVVRTSLVAEVAPRRLVAPGVIIGVGATQALRIADARTKLDGLRALLAKASLTIVMNDLPTRQLTADCEGISVPSVPASMIADRLPVQITLLCADPYYYDTAASTVNVNGGTGAQAVPLGSASVRPVLTITGASVNPNYTVTPASGPTRTLTLTVTMIAGDVLVIDNTAKTITLNGVSRLDLLTGGDFITLDPIVDGVYGGTQPSLTLSSGVSTCVYRKAWR